MLSTKEVALPLFPLLSPFKCSFFSFLFFLHFRDSIFVCSSGYPRTCCAEQAVLELWDLPASAS